MSLTVQKSVSRSIGQRRWQKFKTIKRGYYSLVILTTMYILSFLLPILVNDKALIVRYNGEYHFPAFTSLVASFPVIDQFVSVFQSGESLGQVGNPGQVRYRDLQEQYKNENGDNYVVMPSIHMDQLKISQQMATQHLWSQWSQRKVKQLESWAPMKMVEMSLQEWLMVSKFQFHLP